MREGRGGGVRGRTDGEGRGGVASGEVIVENAFNQCLMHKLIINENGVSALSDLMANWLTSYHEVLSICHQRSLIYAIRAFLSRLFLLLSFLDTRWTNLVTLAAFGLKLIVLVQFTSKELLPVACIQFILLLRSLSEAATLFLTDRVGPARFIICDLSRSDFLRWR